MTKHKKLFITKTHKTIISFHHQNKEIERDTEREKERKRIRERKRKKEKKR